MALNTATEFTTFAKNVIDVANAIKKAFAMSKQIAAYNGVNDPGWSALQSDPGDAPEGAVNADGVIAGTEITCGEVSDAIGSINNFIAYYDGNADVAQSAWGNNLEKIAAPIV